MTLAIAVPVLGCGLLVWAAAGTAGEKAAVANSGRAAAASAARPTLEQMIGEMLIVGFRGVGPSDPGATQVGKWLAARQIGGVILFRDNIQSHQQTRALVRFLSASTTGRKPFVMVDQEGGAIQRFSRASGFSNLASAKTVGRDPDLTNAYGAYRRAAVEMAEVGVNVNLGPVVDLDRSASNPIIGRLGRSYGTDARRVTQFARIFIEAHKQSGILTAAKHFPGHGSGSSDTHHGLVDISATWSPEELKPYRDLAGDGFVDMVLVGHLTLVQLGAAGEPASLSAHVIDDVLRKKIGFSGLVITDDLDMGAIRKRYSTTEAAVRAIAAGNDLLIISNIMDPDPDLAPRIVEAVRHAVEIGSLPAKRVTDAYHRIAATKSRLRAIAVAPAGESSRKNAMPNEVAR